MSAKNRDNKNRWRNITVGFRVSPEENERINKAVALICLLFSPVPATMTLFFISSIERVPVTLQACMQYSFAPRSSVYMGLIFFCPTSMISSLPPSLRNYKGLKRETV